MTTPDVASVPDTRSRRGRWVVVVVLTAVLALAVGVTIGLLVGGSGDDDLPRAEANASAACTTASRLDADEPLPERTDNRLEEPAFWEMPAVHYHAMAAAAEDDTYQDLADASALLGTALNTADSEGMSTALEQVQAECGDLELG
ncbi:hypothetical protein [Nocardioides zeae]